MKNTEKTMDKIVALCKNRGFIFAGSEIYGGLANTWDYGPLGVELKNNVKKAWWKKFVQENPYNVGLDAAILMNPQTWVASGHLGGFSDPLMDCRECHERFRADKLIEDWCSETGFELPKPIDAFSAAAAGFLFFRLAVGSFFHLCGVLGGNIRIAAAVPAGVLFVHDCSFRLLLLPPDSPPGGSPFSGSRSPEMFSAIYSTVDMTFE